MKAQPAPNLEGLDRLAHREGVDIRPTLVRVLTDLYVQKPTHSAEEERHYTELVLRLIDAVDIATRAIVARKLAAYRAAPAAVLRRLACDAAEVAEPVKHALRLTGHELVAVIQDFGPRYAEIVTERHLPERNAAPDPERARAVGAPGAVVDPPEDAIAAGGAPVPAARSAIPDIRLGELFLAASSAERRAILTNLDHEITAGASQERAQPQDHDKEASARLEAAALQHRPEDFIGELEQTLGIASVDARRIVEDDDGEPLLVAAKALALPSPVLVRILLCLNPVIGQSVQRVFDLARFYDRLASAAPLRIVASLRDIAPATRRPAHRPMLWDDEADRGRRAAADSARRPAGQPPRRDPAAPARVQAEWAPANRPKTR